MYLEKAIFKLNSVKWNLVGTIANKEDADLGYEFLRRLAQFFKEKQLEPMPPGIANIANLLGDLEGEVEISNYCNSDAVNFLNRDLNIQRIIKFFDYPVSSGMTLNAN